MPEFIDRHQVQELLDRGAQLVEVLEHDEFERMHLPGAIHMPLREVDERAPRELRPEAPVVVYCFDSR